MAGKNSEALWKDYYFLTREMKKFLIEQDMELFNNLVNERERLQTIINQTADDGFKHSPEGLRLITEIQQENQTITHDLQMLLSRGKRQHQVSEAYGVASTSAVSQMNWKR